MIDVPTSIYDTDTEPLAIVSISDQETLRVPAIDYAAVKRQTLKAWLYDLCNRYGGACDGSLTAFQQDAQECGLSVMLDDIRALHGQAIGNGMLSVLICECAGCEPYIFVMWEASHG